VWYVFFVTHSDIGLSCIRDNVTFLGWKMIQMLCYGFNFNIFLTICSFGICLHNVGTVFGQLWRLEPVPCEKKEKWQREMDWLLCVGDHIVELMPSWQTYPDGSKQEV